MSTTRSAPQGDLGRFTDRVVLITGGGSGIGRATALAFAGEGAAVVVAGRHLDALSSTVKSIENLGGRAAAIPADVTVAEDVAALVRAPTDRFGGLHVAVNNAGLVGPRHRWPTCRSTPGTPWWAPTSPASGCP